MGFMVELRKPKLHTEFEVVGFSHNKNIKESFQIMVHYKMRNPYI